MTAGERASYAARGRRLEYFTIGWNSLEGIMAIVAGALAGSVWGGQFHRGDIRCGRAVADVR